MAGNLATPQPQPATETLETPPERLDATAPAPTSPPPPPLEEALGKSARKAPRPPKDATGAPKEDKEGKTAGLVLLRLGETSWEMARIKRNAGVFSGQQVCKDPVSEERDLTSAGSLVVALPTHQVLGLPLWLSTDDASLFGDMVQLQLEKRGLAQTPPPANRLQIRTVTKENGRTLVLALLLAEPCPDELLATSARTFEPSPLTYPISENTLAFWKEQGQVVMAYKRGANLAYLHAFTHSEVNDSMTAELTCVLLPLMQDLVLVDLKRVLAWGSFNATELNLLAETLEFPVQPAERPGMVLTQEASPLIPDTVVYRREARRRASRMKRIGLLLGAVYLLFLAFVFGQYALLWWQVQKTRENVATSAPTIQRLENTRATWLAMESAIDPQFFAVELFLQSALPLPPSGVRLTLFQAEPGSILIRGEARSFREAQAYFQDLRKRQGLAGYNWELGEQKVLADGRATFQINGKTGYAPDNQ